MSDREVPCAESSCCDNAESMVKGIKARHASYPKRKEARKRKKAIYDCYYPDYLCRLVAVSHPGKRGEFHISKLETVWACIRHDQKQEGHDAKASDVMCRRAPEDQAARQGLYVIKDGGASGRVAGNTLKPSIDKGELPSPQDIWKHSENE